MKQKSNTKSRKPSEHLRKSELRKKRDVIEKSSDIITYVGVDKETEAKDVLKNDEVANDMFNET